MWLTRHYNPVCYSSSFLPLSDHSHQVDYFVAMVHAEYVCVSIIRRILDMGYRTRNVTCIICGLFFFFFTCGYPLELCLLSHPKDFYGIECTEFSIRGNCPHHHHHQSLNREGRLGTTDDFATSFLHFSLFSTAL